MGKNENRSLRNRLKHGFYRILVRGSKAMTAESLERSAIVFSPHQDDETLGCGGTIIRKIAAGAEVQVVFMTDGHQSHQHLMAPEMLSETRKGEAAAACDVLGVPESAVTFLDFPDGRLYEHLNEAAARVGEILSRSAASELYIPYSGEPTDDHKATHTIVCKALAAPGRAYTVYEYPVWFWHHWPWVTLLQPEIQDRLFVIKNTIRALFGLRLLFRFRSGVAVAAVRERKSAALSQHKSQMTRLFNNPAWLTLHDVSDGEFLNNLFQDYEFFYQYVYQPVKGAR